MNVCPHCGANNRPEARFCKQCSYALPQCSYALPQCSHALLERGQALPQRETASTDEHTCAHCGAALRPGARFCKQCGTALHEFDKPITTAADSAARAACPHCGAPVRSTARFCPSCQGRLTATSNAECPHCGAAIRPGARFCSTCSHRLSPIHQTPDAPVRQGRRPPGVRCGTGNLLPLTVLIDRYLIMEKIAQGGMGAIYKAQDKRLQGKVVAVKEVSESLVADSDRERILGSFRREAELLARLEHPSLVRVSDYFQQEERHYMVMEFIEGETLEKTLKGQSEAFTEDRVLAWADQLCDVLSYLHNQEPKIIYRDVKPANIMVPDDGDYVKLIDFGIARFFKPGKRRDTMEFGTYGYAPPEQYGKSQTDERADVYALGATLHHLLTLRPPAAKPFHFPPVRQLNPGVSPRVEAAIMKAVDSNKGKRHQSVEEMWEALLGKPPAQYRRRVPKRAGPAMAPGTLRTAPQALDFSKVVIGGKAADRCVVVSLPAGEQATLGADASWLRVHPRRIRENAASLPSDSGCKITVTLDTSRLRPGRLQLRGGWLRRWVGWHTRLLVPTEREVHAHLEIESKSGHKQRVPISATVAPQPWQVLVGWMIAIGVTVLEIAVVTGALVILTTKATPFVE